MTEDDRYNEISNLNNQLINISRELHKTNNALQKEIQKRKEAEENIRTLLNSTEDQIVLLNEEGKIIYINASTETALNLSENSQGRYFFDYFSEPVRTDLIKYFQQTIQKVSKTQLETDINGRSCQVAFFPVVDSMEGKTRAACYFRDVTEQKKQFENMIRTDRFINIKNISSNIAHEINNSMAGLFGQLSILERKLLDNPGLQKYLQNARTAGDKIIDLSNKMLYFTKDNYINYQKVEINEFLSSFQTAAKKRLPAAVDLQTIFMHNNALIQADSQLLVQMLMYIFINSVEAIGEEGGYIRIKTWVENDFLLISIIDNGDGIADDILEHIMEPFFSTKFLGRGLGLPAAKGIASSHGGTIEVKREEKSETNIQISLPLIDELSEKPETGENDE